MSVFFNFQNFKRHTDICLVAPCLIFKSVGDSALFLFMDKVFTYAKKIVVREI